MKSLVPNAKIAFSIVVGFLLALVLSCSDEDDSGEGTPAERANELRLALFSEPETLDPHHSFLTTEWSILKQINRGLFWYDEDLDLVPMLAREIPTEKNGGISSDGLVYRIKLRDDTFWSDGKELTAYDFEYALARLVDPATESPAAAAFFIVRGAEEYSGCIDCDEARLLQLRSNLGIRAEDTRTLVITLRTPSANLPLLLTTTSAAPVRQDLIEAHGDAWWNPENLVSSGPFTISEWSREAQLVLERNPHWFAEPAQLERVTISFIPTPEEAYNAYLAGEIDAALVTGLLQPIVDNDPILKRENEVLTAFASFAYVMDSSRPPFDDPRVRRAVSMAIDRETFLTGSELPGKPGYSWIPPGMSSHDEDLGEDLTFDPAEARGALEDAGFPGGVGLAPIEFVYIEENPISKEAAVFFEEQLSTNLGISVKTTPVSRDAWVESLSAGELQIFFNGHAAEIADPAGFMSIWTCQRYEGDRCVTFSGDNFFNYANPEFDRVLQQALKETDAGRREDLYREAEKILVADAPAVFLGYETRSVLVKPYVKDGVHTPLDWLPFEYFLDKVRLND